MLTLSRDIKRQKSIPALRVRMLDDIEGFVKALSRQWLLLNPPLSTLTLPCNTPSFADGTERTKWRCIYRPSLTLYVNIQNKNPP